MTPVGRGFDSSFGFLGGSEDHFLHTTGGSLFGCKGNSSRAVDLYRSNASGAEWCLDHVGEQHCSGTHGAYLFNAETQVRFLTGIRDDFRRFVDEIWRF